MQIFTDGSFDPTRNSSSFVVPLSNLEFGVRVSSSISVLSCELYAQLSALRHITRSVWCKVLIITDSKFSLDGLWNRLSNCKPYPLVHKIVSVLADLVQAGCRVDFMWIAAHLGIPGNDRADRVSELAHRLTFGNFVCSPMCDLLPVIKMDFLFWLAKLWPYLDDRRTNNKHFEMTNYKSNRPWVNGFDVPRRFINLCNRLRSSHVCTGEHFGRMGWRGGFKDLNHLLSNCSLLSPGRPEFFSFMFYRFQNFNPDSVDLDGILFNPDRKSVVELGKFCYAFNMII